MSDVVNTSTDTLSRGQDCPGGIPVPTCLETAGFTPESSHTQPEPRLVSRRAVRAGHRCVGGRHQHHRSARPRAAFDQFPLRRTYRGVRTLAGHRGLRQERRLEILHGDELVVVDHSLGPDSAVVLVLVRGLLVQLRSLTASTLVPRGRCGACLVTPTHLPLCLGQLSSATLPVAEVGQVERRVGGRRCGSHSPVDPDGPRDLGRRLRIAADHKRPIPMPEAVLVDPDARRLGGQRSGPDHGDADARRQPQTTVTDREASGGAQHVRHALSSPWLKPGVSRAHLDDQADVRTGQHLSPGGGTTPFTRKSSMAPSTHELDRM